ncbi:MAG: aminopeptidase P N-terminal domain-containing protein, partial [Bacteroidota bacterium]
MRGFFMRLLIISLFILPGLLCSQSDSLYDNDKLPASFHSGRRNAFRNLMDSGSVAFFFSNPVRQRANDVEYVYHQDPNFYYMTGFTEPDAVLIIFRDKVFIDSIETNELIYVRERNAEDESWEGKRLGVDGVKKSLGFEYVLTNTEFDNLKLNFSSFKKIYHPFFYRDVRDDAYNPGDLYSLIKIFEEKTEKVKERRDYVM